MNWQSKEDIGNITAALRSVVVEASSLTVSQQQRNSLKVPSIKASMWVARFTLPLPKKDTLTGLLLQVIDDLSEEEHNASYTHPQLEAPVIEWSGFRKDGSGKDPESFTSEEYKYAGLTRDTSSNGTIVFVYGGAFYMNNQATYRKITSRLSGMTGMRCMTVYQRLAPQNPFPSALLDVFHGYLSLLQPPPESPNKAVPASSIVLAGDSSGACLALALLQFLLSLRRKGISAIEFHERQVELALPAGLTLLSAVGELANSLPSYKSNAQSDVFPSDLPTTVLPGFPSCRIWPSRPPRGNIYCESEMLYHPLASPAASRDWTGAPPLWFASGQEQIVDGAKLIAKCAFNQGVEVAFQEYEGMPHTFMWRFHQSPQAQKCWHDWAAICKSLVKDHTIPSRAISVQVEGLKEVDLDLPSLTQLTVDEARQMMRDASTRFEPFTGQKLAGALL